MISDKQIIELARVTMDQGLDFSQSHITRATDVELIRFSRQIIDAAKVEVLYAVKTEFTKIIDTNITESAIELATARDILAQARVVIHQSTTGGGSSDGSESPWEVTRRINKFLDKK